MFKQKTSKLLCLLLSLVMALPLVGCGDDDNTGVKLKEIKFATASTLQTVERSTDIDSLPTLDTLRVGAAKGESESAQFIINSNKDITEYNLSATDLTCGDKTISKDNVEIFVQKYLKANSNVLFSGYYGEGYYPDCLIPIEYIISAKENVVKAGENQGFWFNVKVPETTTAGIYAGYINFTVGGETKQIPLTLEVFDFAISSVPALKTCYLIWDDWLLDMELDNTTDKHWDYYETLLDYNITGYTFPSESTGDFVQALREYYPKVASYGIPYRAINKHYNDWDYYQDYMIAIAKACKQDNINYFDKAFYYFDIFYDEATSFDWRKEQFERIVKEETTFYEEEVISKLQNSVFNSGDLLGEEIYQTIRNLSHAITTEGNLLGSDWDSFVDLYVQHSKGLLTTADIEAYKQVINNGDKLWYYTTELVEYPNPTVNITDIPLTARDTYWFQYEMGITGEAYWCVNTHVNCTTASGLRYDTIYDPYENACHDGVSNGGGYYLYPGMHYGSDKPFPSMRLAVRRDGIDDYTYMSMLSDRYSNGGTNYGVSGISANNLISFINKVIVTEGRSHLNEAGLFKARETLAQLITAYDNYGLVIENVVYLDDGITFTAYTKNGVSLEINGNALVGSSCQNGIKYQTKIDFSQNGLEIKCSNGNQSQKITIQTKLPTVLAVGYENVQQVEKISVKTDKNSAIALNTHSEYVRSGESSAEVVLSGYIFWKTNGNKDIVNTIAYKPGFTINTSDLGLNNGLTGCEEIYFYVYNAGSTREYEVYVGGDMQNVAYDKVVLKQNEWTKVSITNTNIISIFKKDLDKATFVGLRATENFYDGNNNVFTQTLYVDDVYVGRK